MESSSCLARKTNPHERLCPKSHRQSRPIVGDRATSLNRRLISAAPMASYTLIQPTRKFAVLKRGGNLEAGLRAARPIPGIRIRDITALLQRRLCRHRSFLLTFHNLDCSPKRFAFSRGRRCKRFPSRRNQELLYLHRSIQIKSEPLGDPAELAPDPSALVVNIIKMLATFRMTRLIQTLPALSHLPSLCLCLCREIPDIIVI